MKKILKGKNILITGGTGFLGISLIREILKYRPNSIRVLSRDEVKHHKISEMFRNYRDKIGGHIVRNFVGDVRDYERVLKATNGADIVIHAAALKRIDMIEYNVEESIKTNIIGSLNIVRACIENNVGRVVFISTDKACSPVNTYGACKFVSERIFIESNCNKGPSKTIFSVVRYGNVLESTGSVIPFFTNKIINKEDIPLTDNRMTRFIITSKQAVHLVFNALLYGVGGEVFVPKLPAMKIVDLVEILKETHNSENKIKKVGIRPGEKIHEIMVNETEIMKTYEFMNMYVINPSVVNIYQNDRGIYLRKGKKMNEHIMGDYISKDFVIEKEKLRKIIDNLD